MELKTIDANGFQHAYFEAGDGPVAMLVHGFPDTAHAWRYLTPQLVEAGFRVIAPFLRGYAPTDIPPDGAYQAGALTSDLNALHDVLGGDENAVLVGSDMGALATYGAIGHSPQRWSRAVTLAASPHSVLNEAFYDPAMIRRIYHIFMLQTDFADEVLRRDPFGWLTSIWNDWSPGYDASPELEFLRESLSTPERLHAATRGYFIARMQKSVHRHEYQAEQDGGDVVFENPILYLHGANDGVVPVHLAQRAEGQLGPCGEFRVISNAGHFLHLEQPAEVGRHIVDWMTR